MLMFPLNFSGWTLFVLCYGHKVGYDSLLVLDAAHASLPLGGKLLVAVKQRWQDPIAEHCAGAHVAMLGAPDNGVFHDARQANAKHGRFGAAFFFEVITWRFHWGGVHVHEMQYMSTRITSTTFLSFCKKTFRPY